MSPLFALGVVLCELLAGHCSRTSYLLCGDEGKAGMEGRSALVTMCPLENLPTLTCSKGSFSGITPTRPCPFPHTLNKAYMLEQALIRGTGRINTVLPEAEKIGRC